MDTTPQSLLTDLARLHLRATASPLPADPAAMGWQMQTAAVTGLAARLLHALAAVDPQQAAALADWYAGPFGEGPHPASHLPWLHRHVARPAGASIDQWLDDAQQRAAQAAARPARTLTPNEHDSAWHAIEGTVGDPDADPGTVLNAVLAALRIQAPTAADEQAASPRRRAA
ncbi:MULTISPECIES: hypothetical protein [Streptomyces]|uniref:Uncharacterized protein n=1 Tax=Streptomyces fradiae ATCC 10745 = DSM 40063 TaxID=1319510 RepID=A0A1Y2NNY8_STRFR|nr:MULTISPECIES: hypothetical protein [Streptomyces]KAF0646569.1 hypothetical protein K701_27860 [Streptomyces fradiae ATCC 10745 = DSM 40063]OSY49215.1 hypothetical protein BG846_05193 [Streptomyces fradiae ATCC 10745 = DSM 40063]